MLGDAAEVPGDGGCCPGVAAALTNAAEDECRCQPLRASARSYSNAIWLALEASSYHPAPMPHLFVF
jgi:hypothetical protein